MKPYNNLLVALDLSTIDVSLIKYTNYLVEKLKVNNVYFIHNIKKYEIAEFITDDKMDKIQAAIETKLQKEIDTYFDKKCDSEILISDDDYTESLISYIVSKNAIDLVVVGNKLNHKGSGSVVYKLTQLLNCDLLSVTEQFTTNNKILVGSDLSKGSLPAFSKAKDFSTSIYGLNVYSVPPIYAPYFPTEKKFVQLQDDFNNKVSKFIKNNKLEYVKNFDSILAKDKSIPKKINEYALENEFSMLVVTNKGRNFLSSVILGSVANKLLSKHATLPLLIVKS